MEWIMLHLILDKPKIKELLKNEKVYHGLRLLNIKDGLSNFFK